MDASAAALQTVLAAGGLTYTHPIARHGILRCALRNIPYDSVPVLDCTKYATGGPAPDGGVRGADNRITAAYMCK